MKRRAAVLMAMAMMCTSLAACGSDSTANVSTTPEAVQTAASEASQDASNEQSADAAVSDQEAADKVAALIDAIYVQTRTADTDAQCKAAKEAWDALTDAQKELVEGEEADPDYFGRDTGDASLDDPRNQDNIGEKEILVVSFGTSFNGSRAADIKGIEDALAKEFTDYSVRRAFTAQIIINHVQARENEFIDNVDQALDRAVANGVKTLIVQPTHLMHGAEYDELMEALAKYDGKFETVKVAEPLLGPVGKDATVINADKKNVALAIAAEAVKTAGFSDMAAAAKDGTAFVFMGHGTSHTAKVSYTQMQNQFKELGYENVFVGTVEGEPEETEVEAVIEAASAAGYKKIILRPLMVVAGDHANNDMAGEDEDSWLSMFKASGKFESVDTQIAGLGSIADIQKIYVAHTKSALPVADGEYAVTFDTDSSMFGVNEACEGKGTLTVENGKMSIHISLKSKNIVNLYAGLAANAEADSANVLQPTTDKVTYSDGLTDEVYGFDVPVESLGAEFDLAILGTKGKWYDHKVSVGFPE